MAKRRAKSRAAARRTYTVSLAHRKARGSGHERKTEITSAARQLFVERGVENVTTREIASRVGISQTALFTYYKTKDDILDQLMVDAFGELAKSLAAAEENATNTIDWLRGLIKGYVQFGLTYPDEYRLAFMLVKPAKTGPHEQQGAVQQIAFPIFRRLEERIAQAMRGGSIRKDLGSPMLVAQTLWASMHGLTALLIARPRPHFPWEDQDRLISGQIEIILNGVSAAPAKPVSD